MLEVVYDKKQYPISKFKEYLVVNLASQPPKTEGYKGMGYREPICPNDDFIALTN